VFSISEYLAHSATDANPNGQSLKEHLEHVSTLCGEFAESFGKDDGQLCGLYHDVGKYSDAFQRRLKGSGEQVDHSTAGALLMFDHHNVPAAMCIAGHHAGLADCGSKNDLADTFMARINHAKNGVIADFGAWETELPNDIPFCSADRSRLDYYYYTKMLFSALTDADWLDTEAYFKNTSVIEKTASIEALLLKLDAFVAPWQNPKSEINQRRCRILKSAVDHGSDMPGIFSMTVPTGGGKTVSSIAFALHHAVKHHLRRVIYVIPYCSILEQTQQVFERIFGKDTVIAHYSGAEFERKESDADMLAFSAENWEAPIILTTAVQFFESLYSNKPGKNRKLHNIAESVIVFDEAQMLPVPFLKPCIAGICRLVKDYHCSAVLCTATQPAVEPLIEKYLPGLSVRELCPEPEEMYQAFRRVTYIDEGELSDDALAACLRARQQVLCIVNSRRQAQSIYSMLKGEAGIFHLSTMMIPHDRKRVLREIRARLQNGQECRVISTSLIEAGVDVDFPEVYRALSGLDSIIQAGGRCNREGTRSCVTSKVHIFRTEEKAPRMLEQNISAAARVLRSYEQADSPEAIHAYFDFLFYTLKDDSQLDAKEILFCAERLMFRTVADRFRLIDGADYTVYVPIGEGAELVQNLRDGRIDRHLMRKLQQYAVSVYQQYFQELCRTGAVESLSDHAGILTDLRMYSAETGLPFNLSEQSQTII
jgi:CRISPR-associated endonuclease/helicase Cas3